MKKISSKTIGRALIYLRTLDGLAKQRWRYVSSGQLARMTGLTDVQIRKDISSFRKVGTPKVGYKIADLKRTLEDFVLQENVVHLVLFGVGNLGSAILKYPGFHQPKMKLVAAFDQSASKIGKVVNGVRIYSMENVPHVVHRTHGDIGIIAVPKESAQEAADLIVLAGLKGIVNFAPASVTVPKGVRVKDIDFTIEFLSLFCDVRT
ncbi:MAG: redox-sensing transcriptional repressor Rex [Candidatus Omnitrophica bacterium]|nr:redox-sensing transcriptional repressor Rex [Candidatus Omnitrophota bacterium]MDD5670564.1 redox-sensing transcriptional repressor Rex [Candidatus Omnitrophota bacterium]